ncbi:ECF transporter S component (plasmid) [Bacillus mycoides]|uniref:ECF transporter S component n=1 Tax=Bacillus mycoides TaxID=1405 RepID=A0ABC9QV76_BACMY|nr:ECF transporter S component [Bacillus mycoides]EJR29905.1 hypothetical protein III_05674 [Bacillus mycoides]QWG70543.1 ECF transporter S component [Bacillus mycoides]
MKQSKGFCNIPIRSVKSIVLIAMIASLCAVGRIMFSFIPNVQPVTTIIIIVTIVMGLKYGMIIAILSIFLSNLVLGMGLWTIPQFAGYIVITLLTGLIVRPLFGQIPHILLCLYASLTGFLYGFIISIWQAPIYGIKYFWMYYISGLPFDMYHSIGNFGFYFILAPILNPLLHNLLTRYYDVNH